VRRARLHRHAQRSAGGYIEAKDVGRSLDEIERDEQLTRYRESLSNLILTDYLEFRRFKDGEKQQTTRIAYVGDSGKLRPHREGQAQAAAMVAAFLAQAPRSPRPSR
jgi:hypothetical protein